MIYLITEKNDVTADYIIEWLLSKKQKFKRLNTDFFEDVSFSISNKKTKITLSNNTLSTDDIIFHRRGKLNVVTPKPLGNKKIYNFVKSESDSLIKSIEKHLKEKSNYIGTFLKEDQNYKLTNLLTAKEAGFNIPETLITGNKIELQNFFNKNEEIITKVLRFPFNTKTDNFFYSTPKTFLVNQSHIDKLDSNFSPTFCQKYIKKLYEIRVFIFKSMYYPMAIFSQQNEKTMIDYRNESEDKPNRCVPIILPKKIKKQIDVFMKLSELDSGSIDIIVTPDNQFFFLEINPQGQLDWVSKNCNYNIEMEIANYLINPNEKK